MAWRRCRGGRQRSDVYQLAVFAAPSRGGFDATLLGALSGNFGRLSGEFPRDDQLVRGEAPGLSLRVEKHPFKGHIRHLDAVLGIQNQDAERSDIDERMQVSRAFLQRLFHAFAFRNVDETLDQQPAPRHHHRAHCLDDGALLASGG